MNKSLFLLVIFIIFGFLITLNIVDKFFASKDYYLIIQIFILGFFINVALNLFINFFYKNAKMKQGNPGPKGQPGLKGPKGEPDACIQCEPVKVNLGQRKIEQDRKNNMIFKIPKIPANLPGRPS